MPNEKTPNEKPLRIEGVIKWRRGDSNALPHKNHLPLAPTQTTQNKELTQNNPRVQYLSFGQIQDSPGQIKINFDAKYMPHGTPSKI